MDCSANGIIIIIIIMICTVVLFCMNFLIPRCFLCELSILFFVTVPIKRRSLYKILMKEQLKLLLSKEKVYLFTAQLTLANMGTDTQEWLPHAFHCCTGLHDIVCITY